MNINEKKILSQDIVWTNEKDEIHISLSHLRENFPELYKWALELRKKQEKEPEYWYGMD